MAIGFQCHWPTVLIRILPSTRQAGKPLLTTEKESSGTLRLTFRHFRGEPRLGDGYDGLRDSPVRGPEEQAVTEDLVFIVNYECPRCHAALETRASGPMAWLRCPKCLRASVPPEFKRAGPMPLAVDELFVIGPTTEVTDLPIRPRAMTPMPPTRSRRVRPARLMTVAGFFLATMLAIASMVEGSIFPRAFLFGLVAVVLLGVLIRSSGAIKPDDRHD